MKPLPESMARNIGNHLRQAEVALQTATVLLGQPEGHRPEALEDVLNELQDEAFQARRSYNAARIEQ